MPLSVRHPHAHSNDAYRHARVPAAYAAPRSLFLQRELLRSATHVLACAFKRRRALAARRDDASRCIQRRRLAPLLAT